MDLTQALFTRQQIGELAQLDDSTLNYWSREGLIVPTEGGKGRGSHRRFDFVQVNIAAILGQLRRFGLNIGMMRSFAGLLQSAAQIGAARELHPHSYLDAARLANRLHDFRNGTPVLTSRYDRGEEPLPGLSGLALSKWRWEPRPAETEAEVVSKVLAAHVEDDSPEAILQVAERLGPGRQTEARIYAELVFGVLAPGYSDAYSWLLGFGPDGTWRIAFGHEGANFFGPSNTDLAEDFGPGIYLPVSGIIRKVWGLKSSAQYRREREADLIRKKLAERGITAKVVPDMSHDERYIVDAPGVESSQIEAVLGKPGDYWRRSGEGTEL